jgi:AAA15 family ATPase/GTPase
MRLTSFQVVNCFGFRDSGRINLLDPHNFIYVLGRNSSGKSSLLNAIKYLEWGITPSGMPNFYNFNDSGKARFLIAGFSLEDNDLDFESFWKLAIETLGKLGIGQNVLKLHEQLNNMVEKVREIYESFVAHMNHTKEVSVHKDSSGHFHFLDTSGDLLYGERKKEIAALIRAAAVNNSGFFNIRGSNIQIDLTFHTFEDLLFHQFPNIYLFNEKYSLRESLPDRIDGNWSNSTSAFEKLFVEYLGEEKVNRFLTSNDPDERETLLQELDQRMLALTKRVNQERSDVNKDLLEIKLHEKNGIQITVKTDGKKSYYSHLSDNTKFLFAYYLYQESKKIHGDILLFDEPSNGFHPSAQEFLLNFLQQLSREGNLVIVATHSEHLIDLDQIGGIRLMGVDSKKNITVKNHFYNQAVDPGDYLALQPVLDAIGFKYGSQIHLKNKISITEGVTDLLYIRAFNTILKFADQIDIAPGRGEGTLFNIIPLLISQGISFKIVLDVGNVRKKIQSTFGIDDKFVFEVPIPAAFVGKMEQSGIEDLFTKGDFEKLLVEGGHVLGADFPHVSNNHYMKSMGYKRVVAEQFYKGAASLSEENFEPQTIKNFRTLLEFCKSPDWFVL